MSRIRSAAVAASLAVAALAVPAPAAPTELVLTGTRTGWVDVDLPSGADLWSFTIETKGRFGGFFAEQLTSEMPDYAGRTAGWVVLRAVAARGSDAPPEIMLGDVLGLTPGRVRFYLLADGATTVRIDTHGKYRATLRPRRFATAAAATVTPKPAGDGWAGSAPLTLPRRSVLAAALLVDADASVAADPELCVTSPASPCPEYATTRAGEVLGNDAADGSIAGPLENERVWTARYGAGELGRGRHVARFGVTHVTAVRRAVGAVFSLTLA